MGKAIADRRDRVFLMTKLCTHGRGEREAMRQLEQSLRRLKTDYLDLWQIHECVYDNDPDRHFARGGAVDALRAARSVTARCGSLGFTGHKRPEIHLGMLAHDFPFDTCQLPLNCFDASFRSFEQQRAARSCSTAGIAPIGMKSLGGDGRQVKQRDDQRRRRVALRHEPAGGDHVSAASTRMRVLRQNLRVARGFRPCPRARWTRCGGACAPRLPTAATSYTRRRRTHEGKVGREQHGFPNDQELSA